MRLLPVSGEAVVRDFVTDIQPASADRRRFPLGLLEASLMLGLLAIISTCVWLLRDAHTRTKFIAAQSELNVVEALSSDIRHNFENLVRSIDGTISALELQGIWQLPPEIQKTVLFNASKQVKGLSTITVVGRDGEILSMSDRSITPNANVSDREYFKFHQTNPSMGLHVSPLMVSLISKFRIVLVSKRLNDSDGNFAGVVTGAIRIEFFEDLFEHINRGDGGAVAMFASTGVTITRLPKIPGIEGTDLHKDQLFALAALRPEGTFIDISPVDGRERLAAYHTIDGFPFIVALAHSTDDVFADWRKLSLWSGGAVFLLSGFEVFLVLKLRRERLRRVAAEQHARQSACALATVNNSLEARIQQEMQFRQQALEELAASRRIEALGQLAGGISHDINNVLHTISGACYLIRERSGDLMEVLRLTNVALTAADRGGAITRRLLVFARRGVVKPESVMPATLLMDLQELLNHTLGGSVAIELDLSEDLPDILVDRLQLETVIINLATNARDAMPDGGIVTISACLEAVERTGGTPRSPAFVRLNVCDTGTGMDPETLARAAEPFFSTKCVGQGTGLGLSMAKGFAEQAGGRFELASQAGKGTTVSLWLPTCEIPGFVDPVNDGGIPGDHALASDGIKILLVDDNDAAREVTSELLRSCGFVVYDVPSGVEALSQIDNGLKIDLLLTDLCMPGIDGIQLVHAAMNAIPTLPAIVLTGDTQTLARSASDGDVGDNWLLLQKPVGVADLAHHIGQEIHRTREVSSTLA